MNKPIELDKNGFLLHWQSWNQKIAETLAKNLGIHLSDKHWEVVFAMRDFYQAFALIPVMRVFIKYLKEKSEPRHIKHIRASPISQGNVINDL